MAYLSHKTPKHDATYINEYNTSNLIKEIYQDCKLDSAPSHHLMLHIIRNPPMYIGSGFALLPSLVSSPICKEHVG